MSPTEIRLWRALRLRPEGLRFRRQLPIGPFVLDFYCKAAGLAIEVDGLAHDFEAAVQSDLRRDKWLRDRGVETIRISVEEIRTNLEGVILHIAHRCLERTPPPHSVRSPSPSNVGEDE
jgi:very-short-patch-repair endonuclease